MKTLGIATLLLVASSAASAVPITHEFELLDGSGGVDYTGTVVIDSSRLLPNLFTPFSDAGFVSFALTIGSETWTEADAFNPTSEGIITDSSGAVVSFHDDTVQSATFLRNANNFRIDIIENNGGWSTDAPSAPVSSGTSHRFVQVPEPATPTLLAIGLAFVGGSRRGWSSMRAAFR